MTDGTPRFVVDEMLGKLARELRALGYDVVYMRHVDDDEVLERALTEDRRLLTRDTQLADRAGEHAYHVRARDPADQLEDLVAALDLAPAREAFLSRCLECNTPIEATTARDEVPDAVEDRQHWRCPDCGKVYWLGTHAIDMLERLEPYLD